MDLYETYVRTKDGETYHTTDIREGLTQFLSEDGYRISFNIDGVVITLRRDTAVDKDTTTSIDEHLQQVSIDCMATIRGLL